MIHPFWSSLFYKRFHILISTVLLLPVIATASNHQLEQDNAVNSAKQTTLWENPEWLNLLHYNKEFGGYVSQVDDGRYFYANNGKENPEAELIASIKHLFIATENHNQQTQCQFCSPYRMVDQTTQHQQGKFACC